MCWSPPGIFSSSSGAGELGGLEALCWLTGPHTWGLLSGLSALPSRLALWAHWLENTSGRKHIPLELGACQGSEEGRWFLLTPQLSRASSCQRSACVPVLRAPSAHAQSGTQRPRRKVSPEWLCFRSRVPARPRAWSRISFERECRPFFFLSLF